MDLKTQLKEEQDRAEDAERKIKQLEHQMSMLEGKSLSYNADS